MEMGLALICRLCIARIVIPGFWPLANKLGYTLVSLYVAA